MARPTGRCPSIESSLYAGFSSAHFARLCVSTEKGERALFSKNWDEGTRSILIKYDKLRYRLLPYIYSLAAKTTLDNYTMMRGLAFDFRNDPNVYQVPDQYMFGPAFLVNPVTQQLYTGADASKKSKTRKVYLPKSEKWYDFWTGEALGGGRTIDAAAPIENMPLYVKAGSIVPMGPNVEYANEKPQGAIELRIYPERTPRLNSTRMKTTTTIMKRASMQHSPLSGTTSCTSSASRTEMGAMPVCHIINYLTS